MEEEEKGYHRGRGGGWEGDYWPSRVQNVGRGPVGLDQQCADHLTCTCAHAHTDKPGGNSPTQHPLTGTP